MLRLTLTAIALAVGFAALLRADDAPTVQDKDLEGTWEAVSAEYNGKDLPSLPSIQAGTKPLVIFDGSSATLKEGRDVTKATFKVDTGKTPKTIDIMPLDGPHRNTTMRGIYEVKDDELHLCNGNPDKDRPTAFSAKEGSNWILMTFKRVKQ